MTNQLDRKVSDIHVEDYKGDAQELARDGEDKLAPGSEYRRKVEQRLKLKLDAKMSLLIVIYVLNYIDRSNASAARLKGFEADLRLKDGQFSTVTSILFVGFILFQVPSNVILNHVGRPSIYLPACMLLWGLISTLTGVTHNFAGAVVCRFWLGFVEAAFSPGVFFILSRWYTRKELSLRISLFYCGNLASNAFGSLIAAGVLANMEGVLGIRAWRWLFFIEGAITMGVALISPLILPDFPHNTRRHFTQDELKCAQMRMLEDTGEVDMDSEEQRWFDGLKLAFTDKKVYILGFSQICIIAGTSFSTYFPTLTKTLGFDNTKTLLMAAPPWVFCCFVTLANSWHADKTRERYFHFAWPLVVGILGFVIAMATAPTNVPARYISLFFMTSSYAGYVMMFSWMASSFPRPPAKRAVVISFVNAISQLGSIGGSYVWPTQFEPSFRKSFGFCTAMYGTALILNFWFRSILKGDNKKLEAGEAAFAEQRDLQHQAAQLESNTLSDALQMRKGFRYML